ncbi:NAD(P)-dependent oxidoreductase [Candidatus Methylacidiphilum fumarolicum]|uniref:3-hydroxyisobutyrate dehydrogenase or related beta-hydroxyacid dehydrogenase n=2 Tax=Candidatus Methylacidiphilum fumarolicum TaxID=591154 RepID=I0JWM7_METFB|nr:NAD(P)-dependent oxidoreductase [Candidatus Methylacidiphilum fumarolicum]MBW6414345.1 NAD(P)-dependent oxidoreductase [Candidatus Methylacidiphilum fumarolicum]TFE66243.1 2-hydroxy-3-oxopropionate reductase [Candidatus Methylacidiphilum fumarolicum]TFE73016.1 NAD(P)-dependent oxidoreductase [Candidatus Methylacidiphilum fumarolicum]TFE75110.1 NAD(P)-dependent oxidoreductase [Candidatus Methylacidiphilum fumarolicum]TFE76332.1 2-hydroxy-3-oxopropionate reductase [Candidatus Methylacidiphilu
MSKRIGFVGVGRMGANMARRLHDLKYPVTVVYDINQKVAEEVAKEIGAEATTKLARVTELSDVIFTVVSDDAAMYKIFAKNGDSLLIGAKGKIFINTATISPKTHIEVGKLCEEVGAEAIEACMASSIPQARSGTLYFMLGGKKQVVDEVEPILKDMSSSMRYCGELGSAAKVKALVNMVMNINTAALAEGLGLAKALNLDLNMIREVFSQTGANSRVLQTDGEDMQNREHSCFFSAEHALKDSGIALNLAKETGLNLPLAQATYNQYQRLVKKGFGQYDKSAISELTFPDRHGLDKD